MNNRVSIFFEQTERAITQTLSKKKLKISGQTKFFCSTFYDGNLTVDAIDAAYNLGMERARDLQANYQHSIDCVFSIVESERDRANPSELGLAYIFANI